MLIALISHIPSKFPKPSPNPLACPTVQSPQSQMAQFRTHRLTRCNHKWHNSSRNMRLVEELHRRAFASTIPFSSHSPLALLALSFLAIITNGAIPVAFMRLVARVAPTRAACWRVTPQLMRTAFRDALRRARCTRGRRWHNDRRTCQR